MMKPNDSFLRQPKSFWASVRSLSQEIGYTERGRLLTPTCEQMRDAFVRLGLDPNTLIDCAGQPTVLAGQLRAYFKYRAKVLTDQVEPRLMDRDRASRLYGQLHKELAPKCPLPKNKQKGDKAAPAFFTCIVNMLIERAVGNLPCDFDPRKLTTVTRDGMPLRTLARRVDGAFPASNNPIAVWEIKEYYYTTTFGSRVADGVYETLLDGLELDELREHEHVDVKHYLMIDAYLTWWTMGKPYLCRMIDMLHMGNVDEILFGYEVVEEMPRIGKEWAAFYHERAANGDSGKKP